MEIRPIDGQPGLFRERGLASARWTSTVSGPMFKAPFGNKGRRRLGELLMPAEYINAARPEHISQGDVGEGQVPGLYFTLYALTPGPLVPQAALDSVFRSMLGQLGYDVSSSSIAAAPITYTWVYTAADKSWEAKISGGPKDLIGLGGFRVVYDPPKPADLQGLPTTAETYLVIARPKDNALTPAKLDAVMLAARAARAALVKGLPNVGTELFLTIKGVSPAGGTELPKTSSLSGIGMVLGLIGVGWMSYLAMQGKMDEP